MSDLFVGIDLGGTNVKMGIFDSELNLVMKSSIPTEADMGPDAVVENSGAEIEKILKEKSYSLDDVKACGIGTPGPADYKKGVIYKAANLKKFHNTPIKQMVSDRLKVPTEFENDATTACYGEFARGAGEGVDNMIFYTLGTGVGGGVICDSKLVRGISDNAGELGHMIIYPGGRLCNCGQKGCLEAYASASSTAKRAFEAIGEGRKSTLQEVLEVAEELTAKDVYDHAKAGDELAVEITEGTAEALGTACVNMVHVTDPEKIVFAGGVIAAGDFLLDGIKKAFCKNIWNLKDENVEICFATLGEDAGIIGAAALGRELIKK